MGERKVLNKYIPPDFDPALIPRGKKLSAKDGTVPVRMMLPFTAQCATCHTFLYRGTKFNSKKEAVGGPDGTYLGITRWRFYIKCTSCARPLTFLTDPKNADYEMESGGTRNYEVYKDKAETEEAAVQAQEEEEKLDPMKALENRVLDSQREMQEMASLEAIRAMNTRHVHLLLSGDARGVLANDEEGGGVGGADAADNKDERLTEEDEALIKSVRFGSKTAAAASRGEALGSIYSSDIRRLDEKDEERLERDRERSLQHLERQQKELLERVTKKSNALPVIVKKRKRVVPSGDFSREAAEGEAGGPPANDVGAASGGAGTGSGTRSDETATADATTGPRWLLPTENSNAKSSGSGAAAATTTKATTNGLSSLLGGYGSDDDSDD